MLLETAKRIDTPSNGQAEGHSWATESWGEVYTCGNGGGLSPEGTNMLGCGTGTGGGKEEEAASQVGVTGAPNQGGRGKRTPLLPRKQWGLGGKRGADQTGTLFPNR